MPYPACREEKVPVDVVSWLVNKEVPSGGFEAKAELISAELIDYGRIMECWIAGKVLEACAHRQTRHPRGTQSFRGTDRDA